MANSLTSTGASDSIAVKGGRYFFDVGGTWGGTSVAVQWSDDNKTFRTLKKDLDGTDVASTDDDNYIFSVSRGFLRVNATGGSSIDLSWDIGEV